MCLVIFAYKKHLRYPLILAANRDEYYERPSAAADFWEDAPHILGGRDLREGGTWLGVTKAGRIAALTNYRNPKHLKDDAPSRGLLVSNYLRGDEETTAYLSELNAAADEYNGFNMILGGVDHLYYTSNQGRVTLELTPGIYGLSNRLLDTPWPKVVKGKEALQAVLEDDEPSIEDIFKFLTDTSISEDKSLPDTGIDREWEKILSAIFVKSPDYGTRSSTVIMIDRSHRLKFVERIFVPGSTEQWMTAQFNVRLRL